MADRFHQLILFDDFDFKGDHKHVFRSVALRSGDPWNDRTSSFAITGGAWQLFRDSPFLTAVGSVFCPRHRGYSDTRNYDVQDHTVSSMQLLNDDERIIPHLILFSNPNFGGDHLHIFRDTSVSGSWRHASSAVVFAGRWGLLDHAAGQLLSPGLHSTFTTVPGHLVGIHLADPNLIVRFTLEHLILFDDRDFGGGHKHVFTDLQDLGNWKGRVSAVAVEAGGWQLFEKEGFGSPQGPTLTRGIYPWVEDIEVNNDRAKSVQRSGPAPATVPLASLANLNDGSNILTAHGENYRLGWNQHETLLTPDKVRVPDFGRIWFRNFDGNLATPDGQAARVYCQPLYVSGVPGGPQGTRDLVIVGTANNDLVALDAIDGRVAWQQHMRGGANGGAPLDDNLFNAGISGDFFCQNTSPWHGINSTPVIDPTRQIVFVAYLTPKQVPGSHPSAQNDYNQAYFLDAFHVADGSPFYQAPVELAGSSFNPPTIRFLPYVHTQRAGLTFFDRPLDDRAGDAILVPFSSRCDFLGKDHEDWQGWIMAVQARTPTPGPPRLFATSHNQKQLEGCGGIWGTAGVSVDDRYRIYAATGNGVFDQLQNSFADSIIRFHPFQLFLESFYVPRNFNDLFHTDRDLGGSSVPVLPPQSLGIQDVVTQTPLLANVVVTGGKDGRAYFVNADQLPGVGHAMWKPEVLCSSPQPYNGGITVTPCYFDAGEAGRFIYFAAAGTTNHQAVIGIKLDDLNGETMLGARVVQFDSVPFQGAPGTPFVSSNGPTGGIVWIVDSFRQIADDGDPSILRGFDAVTGQLLYSSPQTPPQQMGNGRKFVGVIALKGRVFVPSTGVACYGMKAEDV